MHPTLFIGLGGTGIHVAARLHTNLIENLGTANDIDSIFQVLCIDTYTRFVQDQNLGLPARFIQNIGFYALPFLEQSCRDDKNLQKWFDCERWRRTALPPAHFDLGSSPIVNRQLGRLCLHHDLAAGDYSKVSQSIRRALLTIQQRTTHIPPLVILCASLIGGTGSAISLDVAYLVRHILRMLNGNAYILGVFALENVFASALSHAPEEHHISFILNEVAAIKEIQHFAHTRYEFGPQGHVVAFDNLEPFDSYWLFGGDRSGRFEGKWPTDYFPLIAAEIYDAILSDFSTRGAATNWALPPIAHHLTRVQGDKKLSYLNMSSLATNQIGDWSYWEDVYNRHLKDPNRLCPHISREFCK